MTCTKEHLVKLVSHARGLASELNLMSLGLGDITPEIAIQKIAYARKVADSLLKTLTNGTSSDPEVQEMIREIIVSVQPGLTTAIGEAEKNLRATSE